MLKVEQHPVTRHGRVYDPETGRTLARVIYRIGVKRWQVVDADLRDRGLRWFPSYEQAIEVAVRWAKEQEG